MADLILTEEEKKSKSYLEWDDAALGKAVKKLALAIDDVRGKDAIAHNAGMMLLILKAHDANSEITVLTVDGLTCGGESLGDWEVTIKRIK